MVIGTRVLNLTIDEGGVPPHIKPLVASIVSAIECGNWGEVTRSTCTVQVLEESQDVLEEALEEVEAELQDVKKVGQDLVDKVENFCKSAEVRAVSVALKKAYEAGSALERENLDLAELLEQTELLDQTELLEYLEQLEQTELLDQTELLEQLEQAEEEFVRVVKDLKTYANGKLEDFEN